VLLSSGDSFQHLIQKHRSQLGFVTYLLNYPRIRDVNGISCWKPLLFVSSFICYINMYPLHRLYNIKWVKRFVICNNRGWTVNKETVACYQVPSRHFSEEVEKTTIKHRINLAEIKVGKSVIQLRYFIACWTNMLGCCLI